MFPWESAWLDDGEVTPEFMDVDIITGLPNKVWSGFIEQHITADVAFGVWQYYTITGDQDYMDRYGYELIFDTARFWVSRLEDKDRLISEDVDPEGRTVFSETDTVDGKYHICDVVGPDEYKEHKTDNAFTNYLAVWNSSKAALGAASVFAVKESDMNRHSVRTSARRAAAVLIAVVMCAAGIFPWSQGTVRAYAEDLPFTIEETDHGIEDDSVHGSMIKITDEDAEFIDRENDGQGVVGVKKGDKYYLIGRNGLVKSFTSKDGNALSVELLYDVASLEHYPYELYAVSDPETGKKDIYNATSDKYISVGADEIFNEADYYHDYYREKGLVTYKVDGKSGLLRSDGTKVCNPAYDYLEDYKNGIVGENSEGCWIITENGTVSGSYRSVYDEGSGYIYYVAKESGAAAFLNIETLSRVTAFSDDYSYYRNDAPYRYHDELLYFCGETSELITQSGVIDLGAKYPDSFIRGNYGVGHSILITRDTGAEDWTEEWIWLSPDASEELHRKTVELYRADFDDSEFADYYGEADYYKGMHIRTDGDCYYIVENSAGKDVMGGAVIDRVELWGKYIVGSRPDENDEDRRIYYFYNYDADKLVAKDVYYTSLNKYQVNFRDIADNELAVVMSSDAPGKFGVIDMNLSSVKFSGYVFDAEGFNDRSAIYINRVHRFADNRWVCQLSYDENDNGSNDQPNKLECILNSDFKVIDDGYVIQDVRSGDTMRIVAREGFLDSAGYYYIPYGDDDEEEVYHDPGMHILDLSGKIYLNRDDVYMQDGYYPPVYQDAYPVYKNDSGYGLVTAGGNEVMPCAYSYVGYPRNGLVLWEDSEETGIASVSGGTVISGSFRSLPTRYVDNRANVYPAIALRDSDDESVMYLYDYSEAAGGSGKEPTYDRVHKAFSTIHEKEIKTFKGSEGYYYFDSYFDNYADLYNQSLATMSLCLAFSSYGDQKNYDTYDRNVKKVLTECGFAQNDRYRSYAFNEKPKATSIGCAIGSKEINGKTLIAVVVRSGGYEAEWASNLNITNRDANHYGFDSSAETVKDRVVSYIKDNNLSGDIKIWITGYSRGAAVATQTAAKLNDLSGFTYGSGKVNFDKKSIYAYGFATPAGVIRSNDPHGEKYNNIFNIIDYHDPVPLVAPAKWGYDRYGTTRILPYKEGCDPADFKKFKAALLLKMGDIYKVDDFRHYTVALENISPSMIVYNKIAEMAGADPKNKDSMGTYLRKLVNGLAMTIGNKRLYIDYYQDAITANLEKKYKDEPWLMDMIFDAGVEIAPDFLKRYPDLAATLAVNRKLLVDVHGNQEYYVYSMQLMDPNYSGTLPQVWGDSDYRALEINCPVDVHVFDSNGKMVAGIENDEPLSLDDEDSVIASIDENGQKVVYLPVSGEYDVKVQAREDCSVSCGFREYSSESGECVRSASFRTVEMSEGEKLESKVGAFQDSEIENGAPSGSSVDYDLTKDGSHIELEGDYRGEEIENHTYKVTAVCDEEKGEVIGGGQYIEGSFAEITALSKEGYQFEGFYIDGKKLGQEDADLDGNTVRIKVKGDTEVEARYSDSKVEAISITASPSVNIAAGKKTKLTAKVLPGSAADKSVVWTSSNTSYASVSSTGVVTTKKAGKGKKVVITAAAQDGSGVKKTITINIKKGIVKKVSLKGSGTVKAGKSVKLKAAVKATTGANKKLSWKSSNKAYATVSGGKVKALRAGKGKTVKITAAATDGSGKKAVLKIKIK